MKFGIKAKIDMNDDNFVKNMQQLINITLEVVSQTLISLIQEIIKEDAFETVFNNYVFGLVNTGQYLNSWEHVKKAKNIYKVYSRDDKAALVEYGSQASDNDNLTLAEMTKWGKAQNVHPEVIKKTYDEIKREGTIPKPAVRRALALMENEEANIVSKINEMMTKRQS